MVGLTFKNAELPDLLAVPIYEHLGDYEVLEDGRSIGRIAKLKETWQLVEQHGLWWTYKENCFRPRLSKPTAARATCRYLGRTKRMVGR
jgi:hypothetical protein